MLKSTHDNIRRVAQNIGLTDSDIDFLLSIDKEHIFEIELENGKSYPAYRMQHKNIHGPYKGGIRFHPDVNVDEVRALSILMSLKTAAVGLPLGGGKGGVTVDPRQLNPHELEELSRAYARHLHKHIGPDTDIPAPDVNTDSKIIDWMVDEFEQLTGDTSGASFTGKSLKNRGSQGREAATGRGGVLALREVLSDQMQDNRKMTVGVQGFGNVGQYFCLLLQQLLPNSVVVAVTDSSGGVYNPNGLNLTELIDYKNNSGRLADFSSLQTKNITAEQIVPVEVDVLVLAALGDVITPDNVHTVKASYVLELANGPVQEPAEAILAEKNIFVIPDVLANAGGVIVSYLEWLQNKERNHWSKAEVEQKLESILVPPLRETLQYMRTHSVTMREAALARAMKSLLKAR